MNVTFKSILRFAIIAVGLFGLVSANAPKASAQGAWVVPVTNYSISPVKSRYHRGEILTIRMHVEMTFFYYQNGRLQHRPLGPAANYPVFLGEHSTAGYCNPWKGHTDRDGNAVFNYQVPLNPNKDHVSIEAFNYNDEPFEGNQTYIPIGT